jgi:large subunit ribosomal protein L25
MAGERIKLVVKPRETSGTTDARRLRRGGFVPGVLYGSGTPRAFFVEERELRRALTGGHGLHAILDVVLDGQSTEHHAVLKEYQLDPVRATLLHVDLHEVRLDRPIQAQIAIDVIGESDSPGIAKGGVVQLALREATVEALPMQMPDRIVLDISALDLGEAARVADLTVPEHATILDDPEATVATVAVPRVLAVEEEVAEEEAEEAAEEGEAAAAAPAEEPAAASEQESEETS